MDFSVSSDSWISNAREATLTNFTSNKTGLVGVMGSSGIDAGRISYTASWPERNQT